MQRVLIIRNWDGNFENSASRQRETLYWVPTPIKHDGEHFIEMMEQRNGAEIFGVWNVLVQLAARCPKRGYLVKASGEAFTEKSIASRTRMKLASIKRGLGYLLARTDWIELKTMEQAELDQILRGKGKPRAEQAPSVQGNGGAKQGGQSGFGTAEPDRAATLERVRKLKRESEWFIETEGTFVRTVQAIFGKEWEQVGGWRKRYREDASRAKAVWEEFAGQAMVEDSPIKRPGKCLNDLWTGGRVGVRERKVAA